MAEAVPTGASVADVGAGDGQLSAHLAARGCRVIAIEHKAGSLARLRERVAGLAVDVRAGDGLGALVPGEVEVAVIAGMGGPLIARVLGAGPDLVGGLALLLLQPAQGLDHLRAALDGLSLELREERAVVQSGRRYTLLVVRPHAAG